MPTNTAPVTALVGTGVFFSGVTYASTLSYGAIVGIENLGISNADYAILLMAASLVGAAASVILGFISDRVRDRRVLVLGCALMGALGYGLIFFTRTQLAFIVAVAAILPFGSAFFSQSFSYARSFYNVHRPDRAEFMMSMLRTVFTLAWAVVPPVVGWIAAMTSVFEVYAIATGAYVAIAVIYAIIMLTPLARIGVSTAPSATGDSPPPQRAEVDRIVMVGAVGVVLIMVAVQLRTVTIPLLIVTTLGGSFADLGIYAGLAAALEVPFIVMWGYALKRIRKHTIIVIAGVIYALYLVLLGRASSVSDVMWLQLLNGPATAALMSIPLSYMQEAIRGRVGLSTSLLDIVNVVSVLASAAIFGAITAATKDYPLVFAAAAGLSVSGATVLFAAHRLMRVKPLPIMEN
jgi:SET family sugar efflux transporter-like MFS transporter